MTLYSVFDHEPLSSEPLAVIAEKFSWFAALVTPVWALVHGVWLGLGLWIVGVVGLYFVASLVGEDAISAIYMLFAAYFGFEAPALRAASLRRRGWRYRSDIIAGAEDLALLEYVKQRR